MVTVDFLDPKSKNILVGVRQRVAMWGNTERAIIRATAAVEKVDRLIGSGPGAMGAEFRPNGRRVLRLNEIEEENPFWIIGDVRGDVLALEIILGFIDEATRKGQSPQIVFLGDLTAGVMGDAACLAIALERVAAAPTRTIMLAGDRELALCFSDNDADNGKPRGLADMPVPLAQVQLLQDLVRTFSSLLEKLPVAVICPGGILLAHSAPARESFFSTIENAQNLETRPEVLRAFAFDRLHADEAMIIPHASSVATASVSEDFAKSMQALSRVVGLPVERMVRGQDAAPEGYRWFRNYGEGVLLTISTMTDSLTNASGGGRRKPCAARLKLGRLRVVQFEIPEELVVTAEQIFPRLEPKITRNIATQLSPSPTSIVEMQTPLNHSKPPLAGAVKNLVTDGDTHAAQIHFERGVRLLAARSWSGARQAFQEAGHANANMNACCMNEAVACLSMGLPGHQDALRLCRGLLQKSQQNAYAYFNMGVSYLTSERNPIEAGRAFRTVTQLLPHFADGWWALGMAFSLRADRRNAADAFAKAAEYKCLLSIPSSLEGIIPARELAGVFEALRGRVRYHPTQMSEAVALSET